ncbi:DUF1569 domain-containing protein [Aurantibacter crassamenti]|uniref:DUF1569 domain-containing protein n=1 Tax=Aurantibacter crassamenti TaxID=1837375 RepID=UPI001939F5D7|nr:DUF1569 domain-containing protein [Aurantibacter crassamenti]MBM1106446.1 DUF1569 domain-containing protein [Aurantibacter crassamenti]
MSWKNLFDEKETANAIERINNLTPETKGQWGKMTVAQMMAHCNVAYEIAYTDKHPKPNAFAKFMVKLFVKNTVVGPKPYKKNTMTSPIFKMTTEKDFELEKNRLIKHLNKTQQLGAAHFNGLDNPAFGELTDKEWNTLFSKHLDHHLTQFGV